MPFSEETVGGIISLPARSYTYGNTVWRDLLTAYDGQSITYDQIGNPLTYRNGMQFSWEHGRQLRTSLNPNNSISTYTYNADGTRHSKTVRANVEKTTTYYYVEGVLYAAESPDYTVVFQFDENGRPYGFRLLFHDGSNRETYQYYKYNLQGDVVGIYDCVGNEVVTYSYDPWGKLLSATGVSILIDANPLLYRGYVYDKETGFYYCNSRYYDPEIGRWINADAAIGQIGNVQGTNMFAYCFNNPVNMSDPTGNWPKLSTIFKVVAVAAAVVAVAAVCVATAGLATVAVVGGGTMLVATATTTAALGVAATAGKVALAATGAAAVSEIAEKTYDNLPRNHTVYGLQDPSTGKIEYVGRTTDPAKRAAAHKSNTARQHLEMVPLATGLNAIEARGVEQIQMLAHHTINTANKMNNQINGISPFNRKIGVYMEAGRGALSYLENQISNEILYWTGN